MRKNDDKHSKIIRRRVIATVCVVIFVLAAAAALIFGAVKLAKTLFPNGLHLPSMDLDTPAGTAGGEDGLSGEAGNGEGDLLTEDAGQQEDLPELSSEALASEYEELTSAPVSETGILKVEDLIAGMSTQEKVAQLFFVTPEQLTHVGTVTEAGEATKAALAERPVGGIIYSGKNLEDPEQTKKMLSNVREYALEASEIPIFLGVKEEGGKVTRLAGKEAFGLGKTLKMGEIGAGSDPAEAERAGRTIGTYLHEYGFNLDFAPVADVAAEDGSSAIGSRAFGSDATLVAAMAAAFSDGLRENGILACYKYFPGSGRVPENAVETAVSLDVSLDELRNSDLLPYEEAYRNEVPLVMAGHTAYPGVTGGDLPASLSETLITDVLKNELAYDGIVITASLQDPAVSERFESGEAAVAAVKAGADMLLMPEDFDAAYEALLQAVEEGEIPESRLDQSMQRILKVKLTMESGED